MNDSGLIQVGMGELRIARDGETLCALLGSCVGIGLLWRRRNSVALAHCLLPTSPDVVVHGARYVNQAVPSLLTLLGVRRDERREIDVILCGGANMFGAAGLSTGVGASNVAAAHHTLAAYDLVLSHEATGGRRGRTLQLDSRSGMFTIVKVERTEEEFDHAGT